MKNLSKVYLVLAITSLMFIANAYSLTKMDSSMVAGTGTSPSMVFTSAYLNLNLTTQNQYSGCAIGAGPTNYCGSSAVATGTAPPSSCSTTAGGAGTGTWVNSFVGCPQNSIQSTIFTIASSNMQSCVCSGTNCTTSSSQVSMSRYGNDGIQLANITCLVPVQMWLPSSVIGVGGAATLFGTSVYVSYVGTMPIIQPTSTTTSFAATWNNGWNGSFATLLNSLIPRAQFSTQYVYFPGCGCLSNGGCGYNGGGC